MPSLPRPGFVSAPLLPLTVALGGGIVLQHYARLTSPVILVTLSAVAVSVFGLCVTFLRTRKLRAATLLLCLAFFCTGILLTRLTNSAPVANRVSSLFTEERIGPEDPVEVVGIVVGEPEPAPGSIYLTVRVERLTLKSVERDASGTLSLSAPVPTEQARREYEALELHHGARIRVMTKLDREDDFRNPGVSQFTEYLERKGLDATGTIKSPLLVARLDDPAVFLPLAWVYSWRAQLQREFNQRFSAETSGVLSAALLGNPHHISAQTAERFRAGGTFHVLVISGLQIAFIAGLTLLAVRRLTSRKLLQFGLATVFLWAYTIAVGAEASVARAALMFTVATFAPVIARRSNSLNGVAAAGLLLLVWSPANLFDPSFQLTFLSVLAIVCLALPLLDRMQRVGSWRPTMATPYPPSCGPRFRKLSESLFWSDREWRAELATSNIKYRLFKNPTAARLERWRLQKLLRYSLSAVVISASVQIVLLPLTIFYFHRVSLASLLLNIFVGVLMSVLSVTALVAVVFSQVNPLFGAPLILLAEKTTWLMVHAVDPLTSLGMASVRLPHYTGWAVGIYVLYFVFVGAFILLLVRWNPLRAPRSPSRSTFRRLRQVLVNALAFTSLIITLHPFAGAVPDGRLRVDFLDVGQGDCTLITMPDGTTILIDGGGRPGPIWTRTAVEGGEASFERDTRSIGERVVSEHLWSRGLNRVDYLLATHADADHIDGLNDVAGNFRVRGVLVARSPMDDPEFSKLARALDHLGIPVHVVGAGDLIKIGDASIEVLWPRPTADVAAPSRNNDGMVVRLTFGEHAFLFAADVEKEAEAALVRSGLNLRAEVVKVAHHGSRTSSTERFVAATHAKLAIISVGRRSMFGHPHKEVVERWRASGAQVMTTGEKGMISVVTDGKELRVSTFVP